MEVNCVKMIYSGRKELLEDLGVFKREKIEHGKIYI